MRARPQRWLLGLALGLTVLLGGTACSSSAANGIAAPTATPGDISLTPDRTVYTPSQPFGITVKNHGTKSYYATDGRTACSYLELQEYIVAKHAWVPVNICNTGDPPQTLALPASISEPFTLAPGNSPNNQNQWDDGTYRVALTYSTQSDGNGLSQTVYSQGFVVQG